MSFFNVDFLLLEINFNHTLISDGRWQSNDFKDKIKEYEMSHFELAGFDKSTKKTKEL